MSWRVVDHLTIYRESGMYAKAPNVVRTPSGDLLVLFHRSPQLGYAHHSHPLLNIQACRSQDEGRTWSDPSLVTTDPLGGVIDFGTHTLPDGSVYLHASSNELIPAADHATIAFHTQPHAKAVGPAEQSAWISRPGIPFWVRSRDGGYSWTSPRRFPPLPDAVWGNPAEHSGVSRSGLLAMPDGRLLLPSKATDKPGGEPPYFGMLRVSHDVGETWDYAGRIAQDQVAHFSEPAIHRTPSGRILVLFRCHPTHVDTPARQGKGTNRRLALVYSDDGGETWSPWRLTTIVGNPGHMLGLRDGRIFVTVGTRWEGQRGCMARVLDPEGADLDAAPDLVVRSDSRSSDCGYPWAVELEDGRVLVVYYFDYSEYLCGIEGTVVEEA